MFFFKLKARDGGIFAMQREQLKPRKKPGRNWLGLKSGKKWRWNYGSNWSAPPLHAQDTRMGPIWPLAGSIRYKKCFRPSLRTRLGGMGLFERVGKSGFHIMGQIGCRPPPPPFETQK